ncbi:glycosyltransferase family 4 protein [Humitalea sp. 24SJ18S-53]|uniref:glycosyltransferase family 4 protein n=1 Tax=Humitalea sp. 24SJ18S-53 TaxID=3422307 RepID=UPI003D666F12
MSALLDSGAAPAWDSVRRPIRLLTFSTLYPHAARPNHGVFVENRLRHLVAGGEAESITLAPVPWTPMPWRGFRNATPAEEIRHGLRVLHPPFLAVPGLGLLTTPTSLYAAARPALARLLAEGCVFDAIDGHYLYPDGVVALRLGREFGLPVVLTARGSDVSQLPDHWPARGAILRAIRDADALIAVSQGLKDGLVALGASAARVTVLRNGVDLDAFRPPGDRAATRAALGLGDGPALLSVGHLIERKGHDRIIAALPSLPGHGLLIVGDGPDRAALGALAERLGVADRVRFEGPRPHAALPTYYGAADALILASSREGWANVLLEAMACGTPAIASPAWGSREAVRAPEAGLVLPDASPEAIAAGVRQLLANPPNRAATRAYAEGFGWEATTQGQLAVFRKVLNEASR